MITARLMTGFFTRLLPSLRTCSLLIWILTLNNQAFAHSAKAHLTPHHRPAWLLEVTPSLLIRNAQLDDHNHPKLNYDSQKAVKNCNFGGTLELAMFLPIANQQHRFTLQARGSWWAAVFSNPLSYHPLKQLGLIQAYQLQIGIREAIDKKLRLDGQLGALWLRYPVPVGSLPGINYVGPQVNLRITGQQLIRHTDLWAGFGFSPYLQIIGDQAYRLGTNTYCGSMGVFLGLRRYLASSWYVKVSGESLILWGQFAGRTRLFADKIYDNSQFLDVLSQVNVGLGLQL